MAPESGSHVGGKFIVLGEVSIVVTALKRNLRSVAVFYVSEQALYCL